MITGFDCESYGEHFPNVYNDLRPRVKIAIRKDSRSFIPGNNPK